MERGSIVVRERQFRCDTAVANAMDTATAESWLKLPLMGGEPVESSVKGWSFPTSDIGKPQTTLTVKFLVRKENGDGKRRC